MHKSRIKQKGTKRQAPVEMAEFRGNIVNPIEADQGQDKLGNPAGNEDFLKRMFIIQQPQRGDPQRDIAKQQGPSLKRNVRSTNKNTAQNGQQKIFRNTLENNQNSGHADISIIICYSGEDADE